MSEKKQEGSEAFGVHVVLDAYNCNLETLNDPKSLTELLYTLPDRMGMRRLTEPVVLEVESNDKKDPGGYSGFVVIAESHISFHTFPKRGFLSADVYTCQTNTDTKKLIALFLEHFKTDDYEVQVLKRGTRYPAQNIH